MFAALVMSLPAMGSDLLTQEWPVEFPGQCVPTDPHFDLELLYHEHKFEEGLEKTKAALAKAPDKDLYWLKTRFMYELGERFQRTDTSIDKEAWYQEMVDTTEAGLKLAPGDPHLRFARGVAMGRLGTTRGVLSSLFMAKTVETDWLSVAEHPTFRYSSLGGYELLPCDAYHALGIYYRLVPDWWIVQVLAGTRGDLDKSLSWHQKSIQCKPNEIQNWKELGVTQLCIAQNLNDDAMKQAGVASLNKCAQLTAHTPRAKVDQQHCRKLVADPSLACEYSRDGQQDLDEKQLEK
jgi:hypothetical protein